MSPNPSAGRDWKAFPLTLDEVRLMRQRMREERGLDWQSFRHHWPMHVLGFLQDVGAGTALGVCLGIALVLWALQLAA